MDMTKPAVKSLVLETLAASTEDANAFFLRKLSYETDPADVYTDMKNGIDDFILIDVRSHAIHAINVLQSKISAETTAEFSKDKLLVVYCWGPGCNGATKAAIKLTALGFRVKEMIGGIEYWEDRERCPVERLQDA